MGKFLQQYPEAADFRGVAFFFFFGGFRGVSCGTLGIFLDHRFFKEPRVI